MSKNLLTDYRNICETGSRIRELAPLIHCITSTVAVNDCANAVLAAGAKPIMAEHPKEAAEITAIARALAVSLANINDARAESIFLSGRQALDSGLYTSIDMVGVNCSSFRMELAKRFTDECRPSVIKGNASEIRALAGEHFGEAGIDTAVSDQVSASNPGSVEVMGEIAARLADRTGAVVLASGPVDIITDGNRLYTVGNGSPLLSKVTGTGCVLNCLIASALSVTEPLEAAVYGTLLLGIAGELAEEKAAAESPVPAMGSYRCYLMDAISALTGERLAERMKIQSAVKADG